MSCEVLKIKGCEISGSSFSGRKIAFTNREITEDTFLAKVKSFNGTILLEINGFKNLNTVYFSYDEMEDFKPTVYSIEIWAELKDLGTELIAIENFKISTTPCCDSSSAVNTEFTLNFGDEIIDYELSITGSKGAPFTYEDFTPEQILELQKPAIDASVVALEASGKANESADLATEKAGLANTAAINANTATVAANVAVENAIEATGNTNLAINSANEATQNANVATGQTIEAINNANIATQNTVNAISEANTATQNANTAAQVANNAKGWTPIFQFENDGDTRQVNKLVGYIGGTGNAPTDNVGSYVTENGYTLVKSEASNFKGSPGDLTLSQADARYVQLSQRGVANGVATLDASVQIPNAQIPQRLLNKVIALGGEGAVDTSFTGLYDRNQLTLADKEHSVTTVLNGAGSFGNTLSNFNSIIFNAKSDFATINGADSTTELVITITFSSVLSNYGRGYWQPFIQSRLQNSQMFRDISVEVMDNNNVWFPALTATNIVNIPGSGLYLFPESSFGTASIKSIRFKLSNALTFNGVVYVSNIGFRHNAHSFAPQFPHRGENNTFFGVNTFGVSPFVPAGTQNSHAVNFGQLSGYVTQSALNTQLANYATLNGVQTFTNTKTFEQSPVIPNGTLSTHAVNLSQLQQYSRLPSVQLITATTSTIAFDNLLMRITMQNGGTLNASSVLVNQEIIISNPSNTTLVINFTSLSLTYTLASKSVVAFEVLTGNKLLRRSVVENSTLLMN